MELIEVEGVAESMLREGGQESDCAPRLPELVANVLGPDSVEYAPHLRGDGALVRVYDRWVIFVRRGLSLERRRFAIAHELFEFWLRVREGYAGADVEHAANYGAAAVLTPRRAFRKAVEVHGHDFTNLSIAFRTTETHIALREAEVSRMPRVVLTPDLVRVRGPEEWAWPDEQVLRRWARRPVRGVTKVRLRDDPRRVVLDAEQLDEAC